MSFQDFGSQGMRNSSAMRNRNRPTAGMSAMDIGNSSSNSGAGGSSSIAGDYTTASDAVLQYKKNVEILGNGIVNLIGTKDDGPLLHQQYKAQVEVIHQLGEKIITQLQAQEQLMGTMSITESSRSRATHIKLTKDFRWVEKQFKNIQFQSKQKRNAIEAENALMLEDLKKQSALNNQEMDQVESHQARVQMQLRSDRVTEEIMREREEEMRKINTQMHQVNEIYKDLGNIVSYQQDQVDEVEQHMEDANKNAESGLQQIEKASANMDKGCVIS